ncbi:MAG: hypothetical protein QOJ51_4577, partial [Acidobacteriaceae bacterium]|nr:hypothetical protein [Acidobacteriaceae bacterium]
MIRMQAFACRLVSAAFTAVLMCSVAGSL